VKIRKYYEQPDKPLTATLEGLALASAAADGFVAPVDVDAAMNAAKGMPVLYVAEEGGGATGFLYVFAPRRDEIEVNALVAPERRRKGVFTALLREAVAHSAPFGYGKGLLVCDARSASGRAVLERWSVPFEHAEHQMALTLTARPGPVREGLDLSEARLADLPELAALSAAAFGMDLQSTAEVMGMSIRSGERTQWVLRDGGKPVGLCAKAEKDGAYLLYGLAIHPSERRRGYARALLDLVAGRAWDAGVRSVVLDVDSANEAAIALYEGYGFEQTQSALYHAFEFARFGGAQ
jgi:ribosomal protein S18 acetylase RimI-like enzyme